MVETLQVVNKFAETQKLVTIDALLSEMLKIGAHLFQLFLTLNPGRKFAHVNLKGDILYNYNYNALLDWSDFIWFEFAIVLAENNFVQA